MFYPHPIQDIDEDSALVLPPSILFPLALVPFAIVLLIPRSAPAWKVAFHRFAEVSIGIAVALLLATLWPEKENAASASQ